MKSIPGPKQERSQKTLEALLMAAEESITEVGLEKTTIASICRRAGCTSGAFYARFADKEALLGELQERYVRQVVKAIEERKGRLLEAPSLEAGLRLYVEEVIDVHQRRASLMRAFVVRMRSDEEFRQRSSELNTAATQALAGLLTQFSDQIRSDDPNRLAGIAILVLHGSLERAFLLDEVAGGALPRADERLSEDLLEVLLRYVTKP